MNAPELQGDGPLESPYTLAVDKRNKALAFEAGESAAEKARAELEPISDLFVEGGLATAAERARMAAANQFLALREAGFHNDDHCETQGIFVTGALHYRLIEQIRERLLLAGVEHTIEVDESKPFLQPYRLHLPVGMFETEDPISQGGQGNDENLLHIYADAEFDSSLRPGGVNGMIRARVPIILRS